MKKQYLLFAIVPLLAASCSIYHPNAVDIPLINHKGDVRVDASLSMSTWLMPDVMSVNATASFGVTDWLAAQAHVNYGGDNVYGQVASGFYIPLSEHAVVEGYAGLGGGAVWRDRHSTTDRETEGESGSSSHESEYSGSFALPFVQLNFGWHDLSKAHIEVGFGVKAGAYQPDFTYHAYDSEGQVIESSTYRYTRTNMLVEPQFQFSVGGEKVRYSIHLGFAILDDIPANATKFTYDWMTLGMGLTFTL